jgi:hypothetical protein
MTMKPAAILAIFGVLLLPAPLCAQDTLVGHHTINLRLKPLPIAEVLNVLSLRSQTVAQLAEPPADEGRPWEVEGADQLEGIVVAVNFVDTSVQQVIAETLGCSGFTYQERGNRIVIERAADVLAPDRCRRVTRVPASDITAGHIEAEAQKRYSWQLAAISALEFIRRFSRQSGQNIIWPYAQSELLQNITLRVDVSDMPQTEVLHNLLGCIGWKYEKTSNGISAFKADGPPPASECRGFTVLP